MINIDNLCRELDGLDDELTVTRACIRAAFWVEENIIDPTFEDTDKARNLAEALARYYYFRLTVDEEEVMTLGDLTVHKNNLAMLALETKFRDEAIRDAADILKDGGFYFKAS